MRISFSSQYSDSFLGKPFPKATDASKLKSIVILGLVSGLILVLMQPFGIRNETEMWWVYLVIFGFGIVAMVHLAVMELLLPRVFSSFFRKWTNGKAIVWYTLVAVTLVASIYIYKSFWNDFNDFSLRGFSTVLVRVLIIGAASAAIAAMVIEKIPRLQVRSGRGDVPSALIKKAARQLLLVSANGRTHEFQQEAVLMFQSSDNYVTVYYCEGLECKKTMIRSSLTAVESQLGSDLFLRCHQSYIINQARVSWVNGNSRGMRAHFRQLASPVPIARSQVHKISRIVPKSPK